ncbi:MAG: replicative helicase [Frankiales bacterium]|nr:replicative helicase [Frankiales bacterium]
MAVANEARVAPVEFDRTPPQDIDAEQSVLGGMLLSKDAIADVVEVLRSEDFYRPAHQLIYDAVLDLYGRGEPADAVTVAAELSRAGHIGRVGGHPYLHTLISGVPTAANAGYYAEIVAERAILRRLVEAGTRIVQMGYGAASGEGMAGSVDDVVDRAQAEVYEVTERRASEDYVRIEDLLEGTLDEMDKMTSNGGLGAGVPTGFSQIDEMTHGLHPGQMIVVAGRPGSGKALALDTPLVTPTGWTTMGSVQVGDALMGADGRPTRVVAVTDVMVDRPCYEVTFSDGSTIVADAEHQWRTTTRASPRLEFTSPLSADARDKAFVFAARAHVGADTLATFRDLVEQLGEQFHSIIRQETAAVGVGGRLPRRVAGPSRSYVWTAPAYSRRAVAARVFERTLAVTRRPDVAAIVTTEQIAETLRCPTADQRANHAVDCASALDLPEANLPIPPYTLGAWLSDGTSAAAAITSADVEQLRSAGVLNRKQIPAIYLRGSKTQRRAMLAGLLDTDGTVTVDGAVSFAVTNQRLATDALELIISLGYRASMSTKAVQGRTPESSTCYTVTFTPADRDFELSRKAARQTNVTRSGTRTRYITDVRRVESVPVRCVQVDNADHMYLAGRNMIPTHNSTLAMDFARSAAIKNHQSTVIFSLEMSKQDIMMRLFSAEARVKLNDIRSGRMTDDDWRKIALRSSELAEAPLFIDDSPNLTMMEIRAKARRLKQRHDLKLIVIDYMQLMTSGKRVESRQQEVSEFSRAMKLLAKELELPVVALSQLNRGPEQRTDKKPMLSDLRESGSIEQDADVVLLVHREDMYERESPRAGEADIIIAKHRNGPTGQAVVAFQGHLSRFVDMPN